MMLKCKKVIICIFTNTVLSVICLIYDARDSIIIIIIRNNTDHGKHIRPSPIGIAFPKNKMTHNGPKRYRKGTYLVGGTRVVVRPGTLGGDSFAGYFGWGLGGRVGGGVLVGCVRFCDLNKEVDDFKIENLSSLFC